MPAGNYWKFIIFVEKESMYTIWSDSESKVGFYRTEENLGDACEVAGEFVHGYDYEPYRVIVHIDDDETDEIVDTYENINPCDVEYHRMMRQLGKE
jgi:hypothetical protein